MRAVHVAAALRRRDEPSLFDVLARIGWSALKAGRGLLVVLNRNGEFAWLMTTGELKDYLRDTGLSVQFEVAP